MESPTEIARAPRLLHPLRAPGFALPAPAYRCGAARPSQWQPPSKQCAHRLPHNLAFLFGLHKVLALQAKENALGLHPLDLEDAIDFNVGHLQEASVVWNALGSCGRRGLIQVRVKHVHVQGVVRAVARRRG